MHKVMIVDDERNAAENLAHLCRKEGYEVELHTVGDEALAALEQTRFDLVLSDLRIDAVNGMDVLQQAHKYAPETPVVLITGHATVDSAIAAMRAGAFHYITKPFRLDEVRETMRKALELHSLKQENRQLREQLSEKQQNSRIITCNRGMEQLLQQARQIAPTDATVLISGESGTGKELMARMIHTQSQRSEAPFRAVNCGALSEELLANELFGHEKGAYTGASERKIGVIESAHGGTLFLDEIGEMPMTMQVKLLRVIQERELQRLGSTETVRVDIRLVSATHRNLEQAVEQRLFRRDLYYRIHVINLHLPPLRERADDIPLLAHHFLKKYRQRMGQSVVGISPQAMSLLQKHRYPGNIRELENVIERAVALSLTDEIGVGDLPPALQGELSLQQEKDSFSGEELQTLAEHEMAYILKVLEQFEGNRTRAAAALGIDRVSLWRKLKQADDQ